MPQLNEFEERCVPIIIDHLLSEDIIHSSSFIRNLAEGQGRNILSLHILRLSFLESTVPGYRETLFIHEDFSPEDMRDHMYSFIRNDDALRGAYSVMCEQLIFAHENYPVNPIGVERIVAAISTEGVLYGTNNVFFGRMDLTNLYQQEVVEESVPLGQDYIESLLDVPNSTVTFTSSPRVPVNRGITRPSSHGINNEAHNLGVRYRDCYGIVDNDIFLVRDFLIGKDGKPVMHFYKDTTADTICSEPFQESRHKFIPPAIGWVQTNNRLLHLTTAPGGYQRGISGNNTRCGIMVERNTIRRGGPMMDYSIIRGVLTRKFMDVGEGIAEKNEKILIAEEVLLFLGKSPSGAQSKYFLMYADICVGELAKNNKFIKIYKG